ncbi:MAG TPA: hypothetical protein VJS92_08745 [Candidatus Polarisedimenticolaceae bacterium]|nr:hypothetical protein [Candidatus Polarisedimenticolaceae bacterium]
MNRLALVALALGATACGGGADGGAVQSGVTLLDVQVQVFTPHCALSGCHTGPGAPLGLDLSAGAAAGNIVGVASAESPALMRIEPFDAVNSYLYMKVTADPRILGDPMPLTGGPLSASDVQLIADWIGQGAL